MSFIFENINIAKTLLKKLLLYYLGINVSVEDFGFKGFNSLSLELNNIDCNAHNLNLKFFNNSNIKIYSAKINHFLLEIGINKCYININGIKLVLMPVEKIMNYNNNEKLIKNENKKDKKNVQKTNEKNFVDKIIEYFLKILEVSLDNIEIKLFNYEFNQENLMYKNPCLILCIPKIIFQNHQNNNNEENKSNFLIKNKKIYIQNIIIKIKLSEHLNNNNNNEINEKNNNTKINLNDNSIILLFNNEKGINIYFNNNNNISLNLGDFQILITNVQLKLLINFINCYLLYLLNENKIIEKKTEEIDDDFNVIEENINNSKINDINNENEILLIFSLDSASILIMEKNNDENIPKFFNFDKNDILNHFCYFNDNFFSVIIDDVLIKQKSKEIYFKINNIGINFIEFIDKTPINFLAMNNKNNNNNNINNDEIFSSCSDYNLFDSKNYLEYDFKYINNNVFSFNLFAFKYNNDKISIKLNNFFVNIHPVYLFKFLNFVYENSYFINELLFNDLSLTKTFSDIKTKFKYKNVNSSKILFIPKEKKNNNNNNLEIEININEINIKVFDIKLEEDVSYIYNKIYSEFYYNYIYLLNDEMENEKILISNNKGNGCLEIIIKDLNLEMNKQNNINLILKTLNLKFNKNNLIFVDSNEKFNLLSFNMQKNLINIPTILKLNIELNQIYNLINFCLIMNYSFTVFNIFKKQMQKNYKKVLNELFSLFGNKRFIKIKKNNIKEIKIVPFNIQLNLNQIEIYIQNKKEEINLKPIFFIKNILFYFEIKENLSISKLKIDKIFSEIIKLNINSIKFEFNSEINSNVNENYIINNIKLKEIVPELNMDNFIYLKTKQNQLIKNIKENKIEGLIKNKIKFNIDNFDNNFYFSLTYFFSIINKIKNIDFIKFLPNFDNLKNVDENCLPNIIKIKEENEINLKIKKINFFYVDNNNNNNKNNEINVYQTNFNLNSIKLFYNEKIINFNIDKINLNINCSNYNNDNNNNNNFDINILDINKISFELNNENENSLNINFNLDLIEGKCAQDSFLYFNYLINYFQKYFNKLNNSSKNIKNNNSLNLSVSKSSFLSFQENSENIEIFNNNPLNIQENYLNTKENNISNSNNNNINSENNNNNNNLKEENNENVIINNENNNNKITKLNNIKLNIKTVSFSLHKGNDFEYKNEINIDKNNEILGDFEIVNDIEYKKKSKRDEENYIIIIISEIDFLMNIQKDKLYSINFIIKNTEIKDFIQQSTFKYLLKKEEENKNFFELKVNMQNSFNKISAKSYTDFNIDCDISFSPLNITIHQISLYFLLNFFKEKEEKINENNNNENNNNFDNILNSINNNNTFLITNEENFNENISIENKQILNLNNSNTLEFTNINEIKNKQFIYITNFILNEFNIYLTYESVDYSFSFEDLTIPLPSIKNYYFKFNSISYKGFATIDEFIKLFLENFLNQISKSELVFNLLKSISYFQPFINLISDFIDIFISPFKSYQRGKGLFNGIIISTKNFMMSIFSQSYLFGENTFYLLFGILGIKKKNKIKKKKNKIIKNEKISKIHKFIYE